MKLNSLTKIEKQAKAYAQENPPALVDEEEAALACLNPEYRKLCRMWDALRDAFCPASRGEGGQCICSAHPRYKELVIDGIQPICAKINALDAAKSARHRAIYSEHYGRLMRARLAKEKWLARAPEVAQ